MRPEAVEELPNGVDVQRFHPEIDSGGLRTQYGLKRTDRVVLFIGALDRAHYFKGVGILLQALAHLSDKGIRLLMVGDGNLRPTYQEQAVGLGFGDRVIFCGRVSDKELPTHYTLSVIYSCFHLSQ